MVSSAEIEADLKAMRAVESSDESAAWVEAEAQRMRRELQRHAAEFGASLAQGVPLPGFADGIVLFRQTPAEYDRQVTFGDAPGAALQTYQDSERLALATAAHLFGLLYRSDLVERLIIGCRPHPSTVYLFAIRDERAVGFLFVDGDGGKEPNTASVTWVAHDYRRQGIFRDLLAAARERLNIVRLRPPFSEAAAAGAEKYAPELFAQER